MDLVYSDVINLLVGEVGEILSKGVPFHQAFRKAPSFKDLTGEEIDRARKEVASRLAQKRAERKKLRHIQDSLIMKRQAHENVCRLN